jgi:hypothetical protein
VRNAARIEGLYGITWWCSHDVARSLLDFPALEYDLGLFTADGRIKPTGERFAEVIKEIRGAAPEAVTHALVLDDTAAGHRAATSPAGAFSRAWLAATPAGGPGPQIVLDSLAGDTTLLADRGIEVLRDIDGNVVSRR